MPDTSFPSVLVFDVNETLLDLSSMTPIFERIFGDKRFVRIWFDQLIMYSMTVSLAGHCAWRRRAADVGRHP